MKILQELKDLIPPLTPDEFATLEKSILSEGVRDRLVVWNDTLIDGHNRYEICQKHGIEFSVQELEFDNLDQVKVWMIDNQKGRRNLTDGWKWELAQKKKALLIEKGRENQSFKGIPNEERGLSIVDKRQHNTQKEIANELGWSTGKVAMADKVWKEADEETKEEVKRGDKSINQAYKEVRKKENKQKRLIEEQQKYKPQKKYIPKIIKADCLEVLNQIDEIDLLLTDPPYFTDGDFTSHISQCLKKVKTTGQAYVFAGPYIEEVRAYTCLNSHHMELVQMLIWNYNNTGQRQPNEKYTSNYQVCFYYRGKDAPKINKPADGKHQYACQTINAPDARFGNRYHKWQKPNELIERLILNSSNVDDFVFDPFAGSGSTLINAAKNDRIAIGCDIDQQAIDICIKRGCQL